MGTCFLRVSEVPDQFEIENFLSKKNFFERTGLGRNFKKVGVVGTCFLRVSDVPDQFEIDKFLSKNNPF
jgi:hypothetical protein